MNGAADGKWLPEQLYDEMLTVALNGAADRKRLQEQLHDEMWLFDGAVDRKWLQRQPHGEMWRCCEACWLWLPVAWLRRRLRDEKRLYEEWLDEELAAVQGSMRQGATGKRGVATNAATSDAWRRCVCCCKEVAR